MNESIEPNLTNAEQSSLEDETAEPNDSQTIDTKLIDPKKSLMQKGKSVQIAGVTMDPPPTKEEVSPEVIV
ncbi:MAG: hypothetical protein RMZ69_32595 [Nostoc sp. ChiQUE01a]|uniref:hypothetical protein n=1 Tax=Nostoc sp. CCY 9925 TaxID=3103865 RepID=UPI002AD809B1|nr:hypothetical protein [Nostoc sp. ChiQUE01a]